MAQKNKQSRWMKSAIAQSAQPNPKLPFARGARRALSERRAEAVALPMRKVAGAR
ncbi:hypothetical protein SAMN05216224_101579 [Thioclava dalianensis]|uniref:hypothetical protein n=1 Tax=Thioclava dalianensis TaxID=1185766 RepID=UPI0008F62921|nr:hypothetical protein [Thioclava dalianensis]SFM84480.1 hypothetical protein SAMN05216224_101579 [Thioclava dalianensis]